MWTTLGTFFLQQIDEYEFTIRDLIRRQGADAVAGSIWFDDGVASIVQRELRATQVRVTTMRDAWSALVPFPKSGSAS